MAASTALPPFFKMSIPTCVAAGTLVQTIPCLARTSERVAKFLPVIRSTCAEEIAENANKVAKRTKAPTDLMAGIYRVCDVCQSLRSRKLRSFRQTLRNVD